ncbi:MAG: amidohydrolase family protein, partial [Gemmatimonadetes bacterium]|nr:amidohydrolase family protein [Gemmatimonadota bacterium]
MTTFTYQDFDRRLWERELEDFVPATVYDMHTHMWSEDHRGSLTGAPTGLREEIDYQDHLDWAAKLYPGRAFHMLVLGTPMPGMDAAGHNAWMAAQLAADPESAINMMVTPDMTPEYVAAQVDEYGFLGLKPYRTFAPDPVGARICDFLPESLIEVAHHKKLAITMHLAKPTGPADPDNQRDLARYTREYPNAQWILAHCARSFNSFMMEEAVHFLCDLPNIWYDYRGSPRASAGCQPCPPST